jgi:LysM repeat protein
MSRQESPQEVIEAYRRRQKRSQRTPRLILAFAMILLIVGAALIIFWFTGAETPELDIASVFASETPTPTETFTPTPIPPTLTPSLTPTEPPPTVTPEPSATPTQSGPVIYVVEEGDNFYAIAEKFDIDILVLLEANRERLELDPANPIIKVGDEILVPPPGTELPTPTLLPDNLPPGTPIEYVVQPGDSLGIIAQNFNTTTDDIVKRNEELEENPNALYVGQVLTIRVNLVTPVPTAIPEEQSEEAEVEADPGSVSTLTPTP